MRAREFIQLSEDETLRINTTIAEPASDDLPEDPVFVSPLQQQLELQKQQGGKSSQIINQIINGEGQPGDDAGTQQTPGLAKRKAEPIASIYAAKGNPVEPNATFSNVALTRKVK